MRAVGKSTMTKFCANVLGYKLIDLDNEFANHFSSSIKEYIGQNS